jgi:hypothetical protein
VDLVGRAQEHQGSSLSVCRGLFEVRRFSGGSWVAFELKFEEEEEECIGGGDRYRLASSVGMSTFP